MKKLNKPSLSIFTQDGKKLGDSVTTINCLKPNGDLPKKTEWKYNGELKATFDIKLTEEDRKQMKLIENLLFEETSRQLENFYKKVDKMVEIMLRNYVTPPIKGEITKGKVRWRGLRIVWQKTNTYDAFVGIRQRDVLILPNGDKIPWNNFEKIEKSI